jgi:hypothetical protein
MKPHEFEERLQSLLDEYGKASSKDGAFCTTYFLVAEFFDADGKYWASTVYDEKSPQWRVTGLVQHALENDFTNEGVE